MCWENINTEQRERKIYSRLIYIRELSSITKEIIKQDESVFKSFAEHFQGCNLFIFLKFFRTYYNEKAKLRSENDSKLNMFFWLKSEEIANMRKKSAKL